MSPKKLLSFVFCLCVLTGLSQEPTDCINSVVVCGNSNVNLDVGGIGTQELNGTNTCSSQENNSIWLRVSVVTSGTMGFILTPTSNAISEDYDFFVFGPNVSCGNIGQAIRCSTTNPMAAGQGNNRTGMDGNSNDTSEGPGPDGNSFVRWIDAEVGDSYFIVIDRPLGNSSFSLEWIGTATFAEPPQNQVSAGNSIDLERCDVSTPFDDGLTEFDLSLNTNSIIGSQNDVEVSYHLSESDANIGDNPLDTDYTNISNPQTIFYRITSTITNCFDIGSFELVASLGPDFNDVGTYRVCDNTDDGNDSDGRTTFDLDGLKSQYVSATDLSNVTITYHRSIDDAENRRNAVNENYYNSTPNQEELFVRIEDNFNQQCRSLTRLQLVVDPLPIANAARLIQCDEDGILDGKTFYNLKEIESDVTDGVPM